MKTIMVVDDEESIRELLNAVLTHAGFNVVLATCGSDCLTLLKKKKPDLILMDMMMPDISGRETTELIRKDPKLKSVNIVFLTVSKFSESGLKTLKQLKVLDYINKPFENEMLISRIKKILKVVGK